MKDKLFTKKSFPIILGITALLIAMCAAFFSVYGISTLFAGAFLSVVIMASSLEIGKLVGVTFLYRYWTKCKFLLRTYLVLSSVILMLITSLGIFGYLSAAYQKSSIEFTVMQEKIKNTEAQKPYIQDKIDAAKKRVDELSKLRASQDSQISSVLTNEFFARNPLQLKQLQQQTMDAIAETDKNIKEENLKIQANIDEIYQLDDKVNAMKLGSAEKKDVQTFKFVADALNTSLDNVARWFIISIIFVFDPLAICLVLAYNVAVFRREDETVYDVPKVVEPTPEEKMRVLLNETIPKSPKEEPAPIQEIISEPIVEDKKEDPQIPKSDDKEKTDSGMSEFFRSYFKR